jgi:hypothetical protein
LYTQSFNELKDLWKRNKALTKPEEDDAENEEAPPANDTVKKDESDE